MLVGIRSAAKKSSQQGALLDDGEDHMIFAAAQVRPQHNQNISTGMRTSMVHLLTDPFVIVGLVWLNGAAVGLIAARYLCGSAA